MELGALEKFLTSLKYVAQSPLALLGLFVVVGLWAFSIFGKRQVEASKDRLSIIEKLPVKERAKAFDNEYKTVPRKGISSQQWLTWQKHKLVLIAFIGTLFFIATIIISALWFSSSSHFEKINESSKAEDLNNQTNTNSLSKTGSNSNVSQENRIVLPVTNKAANQPISNTQPNTIQNINSVTSQNTNFSNQTSLQPQQKLIDANNRNNVTSEQLETLLKKAYPEGTNGKSKNLSAESKQEIENIRSQLDKLEEEALTMSFANFSDAYQKAKTWYDNCAITLGKADVWMRKYYQTDSKYRHDFESSNLYISGNNDDEKIKRLKLYFESQLASLRVQQATINVDLIHYS